MAAPLPLIWRRFPDRYTLLGNYCETCGTAYFPSRKVCPKCRRKGRFVEREMPKTGKLLSYTKVFVGSKGFEYETPYYLALIELDNGAKLLSQLVDSQDEVIKIGARVEKCFRKIYDTKAHGPIGYGYKFKVVG